MPERNKYDRQHLRDVTRYGKQIEAIYEAAAREAAALGASIFAFNPAKPFAFADYPQTTERLNRLLAQLQRNVQTVVVNGISSAWTLSNNKNNELANQVFGNSAKNLPPALTRQYYNTNEPARQAFLARKSEGLGLSDRVWKYTNQFKENIETVLDHGLRDGLSAADMARNLKQYLQNPDAFFPAVHNATTGRFERNPAYYDYHPGAGVSRSAYKNSLRLARTETNMAYRAADHERWQQMSFVVGFEVHLSESHPKFDICDVLAGRYPKGFKFTGWHPNCFCFVTPILKTIEEMKEETRQILAGEPTTTKSVNEVTAVPPQFAQWVRDRRQKIDTARYLPYFLRDNKVFITGVLAAAPVVAPMAAAMNVEAAKWLGDRGFVTPSSFVKDYNDSALAGFDMREFDEEFSEVLQHHGAIINYRNVDFYGSSVKLHYRGQWQGEQITLQRKFSRVNDVKRVEHEYFAIPKGLQGQGLSKQVFQALYKQYQAAGVDVIEVYANIDVGGYTWAKYGFRTTQGYAERIIDKAWSDKKITSEEADDAMAMVRSFFAKNKSASRFPMNLLADKEYGKRLLLSRSWDGEIDLRDPDQRAVFENYLRR